MSIEQIGEYNKLPSKDLKDAASRRAPPASSRPAEADRSDRVEITRTEAEEASRTREAEQGKNADRVDLTPAAREGRVQELPERVPVDSLELSWRDPESVQRIRELVDKIREYKSKVSKRIEAARILIMSRAYDDADQVRKTAEAVLRGESEGDLEDLAGEG